MNMSATDVERSLSVLLIDDQPLAREALAALLARLDVGVRITETGDLATAASFLRAHRDVALVVIDIALATPEDPNPVEQVLRERPHLPIIVVSTRDDPPTARAALEAGARGFISKRSPTRVLSEAMRLVLVGGTYVPPQVLGDERVPAAERPAAANADALALAAAKTLGLTPRQLDVLTLLVQGKPNKLICRALDMADGTVRAHTTAIYRALGVGNRTQALFSLNRLGVSVTTLLARAAGPRVRPGQACAPAGPSRRDDGLLAAGG